jgi:hypothetical protein
MRKLLVLLLICVLAAIAVPAAVFAAPSLTLPQANPPLLSAEDEADASESDDEAEEEEEEITAENCEIEDEEDVQLCAEIAREERELAEVERCVLESASASVDANRSSGKVRLTVRYTTYGAAPFSLRYSLRGGKGGLQLGSAKARFGRAGVFHDVVRVNDRKLTKVLAAREFQIELRALSTPSSCRERLTVQRRGASRLHWS